MEISRSALVPYSPLRMYTLVHDVENYPEFLNWCRGAEVHEDDGQTQLASLHIRVGGLAQSFTTRNRLEKGERLIMSLVDGPFKRLAGDWQFLPLGEIGTKVMLNLQFEFSSSLLSSAFRRGFTHIADQLVKQFCRRADEVHWAWEEE